MTLTRLLEIEVSYLSHKDQAGLRAAEGLWESLGSPIAPQPLSESLEKILQYLPRVGIRYPKIILKRKRQLDRGDWSPPSDHEIPKGHETAHSPLNRGMRLCSLCGDSGFVPVKGSQHISLCPNCSRYMR